MLSIAIHPVRQFQVDCAPALRLKGWNFKCLLTHWRPQSRVLQSYPESNPLRANVIAETSPLINQQRSTKGCVLLVNQGELNYSLCGTYSFSDRMSDIYAHN